MKRSPIRRHAPLAPGKPPKRNAPIRSASHLERSELRREARINPVNRERRAKLRAIQFGEHADTVRSLPCCACGSRSQIHPHHVRSRGAGGTAADLAPLCMTCHDRVHTMGRLSFEAAHGIDLAAVAAELWARHGEEVGA